MLLNPNQYPDVHKHMTGHVYCEQRMLHEMISHVMHSIIKFWVVVGDCFVLQSSVVVLEISLGLENGLRTIFWGSRSRLRIEHILTRSYRHLEIRGKLYIHWSQFVLSWLLFQLPSCWVQRMNQLIIETISCKDTEATLSQQWWRVTHQKHNHNK